MNRQLHNCDEVFISPQQGWEQMHLLLDEKLPVKNENPAKKFHLRIAGASLLIVFLMSTLPLNNTAIINSINKNKSFVAANKPQAGKQSIQTGKQFIQKNGIFTAAKNTAGVNKAGLDIINKLPANTVVSSSNCNDLTFRKATLSEIIGEVPGMPSEKLPKQNIIEKMGVTDLLQNAANNDSARLLKSIDKSHQKRSWSLSAGLAMNAAIGQQQHFKPYPAAVLCYNVSKNFFLSLGLSAGSYVSDESWGVKKMTYLNDMVNNIQFYNTVKKYNDFSYADIPLLAGLHISKKISLQAGIQASVLLKTKTTTIIEQYDFQMRFAGSGTNVLPAGSVANPVSETEYKVEAGKVDYRFTSGIKYEINKLAFNLMYQHSLQPVLTGDFTSRNKHQLVTLNIQFKIR